MSGLYSTGTAIRRNAGVTVGQSSVDGANDFSKERRLHPVQGNLATLLRIALIFFFIILCSFLYWLSPALIKAYKGVRAPNYPSEDTYDDGTG